MSTAIIRSMIARSSEILMIAGLFVRNAVIVFMKEKKFLHLNIYKV